MIFFRSCGKKDDGGKYIKVGNGAGTYDIKAITNQYKHLTKDHFIVESGECSGGFKMPSGNGTVPNTDYRGSTYTTSASISKSYNANTGILTITNGSSSKSKNISGDTGSFTATVNAGISAGSVYLLL